LLKFVSMFLIAYLASKYLFPSIFRFAAKNQELLLISSLAVCFLFSIAFYQIGFSIAIGAFIAGVTLGNLDYSVEIAGKVKKQVGQDPGKIPIPEHKRKGQISLRDWG